MKLSLNWLSDFVRWKEEDPQKIAERLTASTAEVEEVEIQGGLFDGCCVGKIMTLKRHPNADRLSLCDVETDRGLMRVVCGGTNLREGMLIPFVHVGAKVKSAAKGGAPVTIEHMTFRGEESNGMVCAAEELGLEDRFPPKPEEGARPVLDLSFLAVSPGISLSEALGMNDVVFHIDNHAITHRPDLFSHRGFARECVALGLATWKKAPKTKPPTFPHTALPFVLHIEDKKLMPRYCACLLEIDGMGETPEWMRRRLEATGFRSISLPVDITNYVMLEVGVPLHSFDADDFKGDIHVRAAREGERITTLDGVDRLLPPGAIVISDDLGIFDLLGIMGGLRSSTKDTTRHIYLHSASLHPASIRMTVIATGHRTDAATVYEKGVPPIIAKEGFFRALGLFLALVPGAKISSKLSSYGTDGAPRPIRFSAKDASRVLGIEVPEKTAKDILTGLGFKVGRGSVTPPLWRLGDISGPHDLVEEVGRIYGFDRIKPRTPADVLEPPPRDQRTHAFRRDLKEAGFIEILPLSLLGPDLLKRCRLNPGNAPEVENALGEEMSLMQTSTFPRLLEHAGENMLSVSETLRAFTCAHVFSKTQGEWLECGMIVAERRGSSLLETPFLELKQFILDEFRGSGLSIEVRATEKIPFGHPGRSADIVVGGKAMGMVFEVHPQISAAFDLPGRAAAALLDLTSIFALPIEVAIFRPLPQFPAIVYDLTVTLDSSQSADSVLRKIHQSSSLLEDVQVADLYDGAPLKKGQYNLTVRCTYRAKDRTLTEEEIKKEHERLEKLATAV